MKMVVRRSSIEIIPESEIDDAYIEEVLGLEREGDQCVGVRVDVMGTNGLAYINIRKLIDINK